MSAGTALGPLRRAVRLATADLPAGALVLVACSGGADSLALAAATAAQAPALGLRAGAVVIDHDLQAGSARVASAAADACTRLALAPVEVVRVRVASGPGAGGPEAAARDARYDALGAAANRHGAAAVLLGHTRDDQAETVLLGLARGSGARSLSGMAARSGAFRRPLLTLSRAEVRAAAAGLAVVEDPHNADPRFARARVRHEVLPAMEAALGPGVAAALARSAELLRADADALDTWAGEAYADLAEQTAPGEVVLPLAPLVALPDAVRTRVLRLAGLAAGVPAGRLTREHVLAVDHLARDPRTIGPVSLPSGVGVHRGCGRLRFTCPVPSPDAAPPGVSDGSPRHG